MQWLGDLGGRLSWGDTAATLVGQGHGLAGYGDKFVAQQVEQGSIVEVLEPQPPGLGELAKELALRQCSLLRAEAGGVPSSPEIIERLFRRPIPAVMLDAVFWRARELPGG